VQQCLQNQMLLLLLLLILCAREERERADNTESREHGLLVASAVCVSQT
jgi:hypothetical protein